MVVVVVVVTNDCYSQQYLIGDTPTTILSARCHCPPFVPWDMPMDAPMGIWVPISTPVQIPWF